MTFSIERAQGTINAHRGPFVFCVTRPDTHRKRTGYFTSQWLLGETGRDDVIAEAQALLADPRDTLLSIAVWSLTEGPFVYSFRKGDFSL